MRRFIKSCLVAAGSFAACTIVVLGWFRATDLICHALSLEAQGATGVYVSEAIVVVLVVFYAWLRMDGEAWVMCFGPPKRCERCERRGEYF